MMGLTDQSKQDYGDFEPVDAPSSTFGDVFMATAESQARNLGYGAKGLFTTIETSQRDKRYRDLTGRSLEDDAFEAAPNKDELRNELPGDPRNKDGGPMQKAIDSYLSQLKEKDPYKFARVLSSDQIAEDVKTKAKSSMLETAKANAGATGFSSIAGSLAGGITASLVDPINLATIPLGAPLAAGIFKTAMLEAGINVGAEVVSYPFVKKWQEELGQEYGAKEFAENAVMAAGFGALFGGATKALSKGLEKMNISNSAKISEMRSRFDEVDNVEASEALRHEERRLHIDEADPARYSDAEPDIHAKALEEVDAAINEGRSVNIDIPDDVMKKMDPQLMDDGAKAVFKDMKAKSQEPVASTEPLNEIFKETKTVAPSLERQKELLDHYESPEFKKMEQVEFNRNFPDPKERISLDDGTDMSVAEMRELFNDDKKYVDALSSCTLAGFKVTE